MLRSLSNMLKPEATDVFPLRVFLAAMADSSGNPPRSFAYQTTGTYLTNTVAREVALQAEEGDAWDMHSSGANTRITPTVAGRYTFSGQVGFATNSASGGRYAGIRLNGSTLRGYNMTAAVNLNMSVQASAELDMNGTTDYVELVAYQNSGADMNTRTGRGETWLSARRIGDL